MKEMIADAFDRAFFTNVFYNNSNVRGDFEHYPSAKKFSI